MNTYNVKGHFSFLVDAESQDEAKDKALALARQSKGLIGWDLAEYRPLDLGHNPCPICPDGPHDESFHQSLLAYLTEREAERRDLDFARGHDSLY